MIYISNCNSNFISLDQLYKSEITYIDNVNIKTINNSYIKRLNLIYIESNNLKSSYLSD